jgi:hypothetical protein
MQTALTRGFTPGSASALRRIAFYIFDALLLVIVTADFISHALDFEPPHHVHVVTHEIVSATVIACVLSQLIAPRRFVAAAQQLLLIFVIGWLFDALTLRLSGIGVIMLLAVAAAALHPARDEVFCFTGRFRLALAILSVLAAIPLTIFSLGQAANQRDDVDPVHAMLGHWEWVATLAAVIFLFGLLAALGTRGSRIPAWSAGLGAIFFGVGSLMYSGEASSLGTTWSIVAIAGGVIFIAVAEWETRHTP